MNIGLIKKNTYTKLLVFFKTIREATKKEIKETREKINSGVRKKKSFKKNIIINPKFL